MATLESLKRALRASATTISSSQKQPLSDTQYSAGFDTFLQGSGWATYQEFIIPQLSQLLASFFNSRTSISVLEIGPGPKSVIGYLPSSLKRKVRKYAAFEPRTLFATKLEEWFCSTSKMESPLPCLEGRPEINQIPFALDSTSDGDDRFDVILFCHSMYGMAPKHRFIERALEMLVGQPESGIVVVFHRNALHIDDLMCYRSVSFPTGIINIADDDSILDSFCPFVAGFALQDVDVNEAIRLEWRKTCRALGRREDAYPGCLLFSSPEVMMVFTQHATALPELTAQLPSVEGDRVIKNREARLHRPALIVKPTEVRQIQQCVRWAVQCKVGLTIIGGGHSGHCLWPNVVSVDMSMFDKIYVSTDSENGGTSSSNSSPLVVAEAGCKTGDIVRKTMAAGLTVPLGSRPSVGAGLWLQGGIGHLARLHGLACDAIVGAVVVSVDSGQILCVGRVPNQHQPAGAMRPANEKDLLWAMKGAGTNFGIVVSITFKAYAVPTYSVRNWVVPLSGGLEAQRKLGNFDQFIARKLSRECSADVYLYWDTNQLHLGVTMYESSTVWYITETANSMGVRDILGPEDSFKIVDGVGLFDTEMYMSEMHGGHGSGKTSSFKRCVFLKNIGAPNVSRVLVAAVESRPSPLCYLHLLHGGGAVGDMAADISAFGCRNWDFACVVTGVWPRDQDETEQARAAVRWVYAATKKLLPLCKGVYGADLGPDPRDAALVMKAFGPNLPRLARLKRLLDPHNVLAYACPLPNTSMKQKLIILVTGEHGAGKDYCANLWVSVLTTSVHKSLTARAVSISDATKREYALATGADLERLLRDRAYKEQHRSALTAYFQDQVQQRPRLPEEHFLNVVNAAADVDVLLITGMRDEAPVAALSHLVTDCRLLEVRVKASKETLRARRGYHDRHDHGNDSTNNKDEDNTSLDLTGSKYRPSLIFENDMTGDEAAKRFAQCCLLPFFHEDLKRLADMVRRVSDFPRPGIEFRHVLGISEQPGGLTLCTSLLRSHFIGDWAKIDVVACCEAGGFIYASALAAQIDAPLVLIREAGKLPPPTISVTKSPSHISSFASDDNSAGKRVEMGQGVVPKGASVVVVDDVLATGKTLCAVLQLLNESGISAQDVSVMTIAEFPIHRGREFLRLHGFGQVTIQSLLVFDGA
ncbi:phosphoribosyl transferase domain protein [Hypoxylon argillaceum]|nr:phosphoribosyl transferase domain protein [Hypoxylon argillaceum]